MRSFEDNRSTTWDDRRTNRSNSPRKSAKNSKKTKYNNLCDPSDLLRIIFADFCSKSVKKETMNKSVKWLLVGAGDIARKRVAPALARTPGSQLTAICDARIESARALAGDAGVNAVYDDYDAALKGTDADAVYLATPVGLHVGQAISALQAGKHVLVEKPLGLSGPDCRRAAAAAEKSGLIAGCAYFRRLSPRYLQLQKLLQEGKLGKIILIRMVYYSLFNPGPADPKYWRVIRKNSGGGPLSDMGTHMFDVMIGLLGMPAAVFAKCANLTTAWDVEDSAAIIMTMPGGALVTASFNWNCSTWRHEFEVVGADARVNWLPYDAGPVEFAAGRSQEKLDLPNPDNVHQPLIADFVRAAIDKRPPAIPLDEAAKTNILLDAVYQSARENREIAL